MGPIATARPCRNCAPPVRFLPPSGCPAKVRGQPEAPPMSRPDLDLGPIAATLQRIAGALDRLSPRTAAAPRFDAADAFVWHPQGARLDAVARVNRVDMTLLNG